MRYEKLRASLVGLLLAATALGPAVAGTTTVVESFDGGGNEGGWTWGFGDTIAATGGIRAPTCTPTGSTPSHRAPR
jgi:hypothetical protein